MNIVFLGTTSGYGHLYVAANKKTELLARGLHACGNRITIHNGIEGVQGISDEERYDIPDIGHIISYPRVGKRLYEPITNFRKLREDLISIYRPQEKNIIILLAPFYHIYFEYQILAKLCGYKIVVISHEWQTALTHPTVLHKILRYTYSRLFGYGIDAILPISDFIIKRISHFNKPILKTPVLGEFIPLEILEKRKNEFIYCGTVEYERAFMILVEAYKIYASKNQNPATLTLVLSGRRELIDSVKHKIGNLPNGEIKILTGLTYRDLYKLYSTATALLLPLDPDNRQDKARFSQKIAEYIASGTPMITNPVGEINNYFTNKESAIITPYSPKGFALSMEWVTSHMEEGEEIGRKGWNVGKKEFDYLCFGKKLNEFLNNIQ